LRRPTDWSPDARHILFQEDDPKTRTDLWVLEMPERKAVPYLRTQFIERDGRFSPDGRWVAYVSNESGRDEVYVRPFPSRSGKWPISIDGGIAPQWQSNGQELIYRTQNGVFMTVSVKTTPQLDSGIPRALFTARIRNDLSYSISKDGQRFLLNPTGPEPAPPAPPITVVTNWTTALKK
jgi:eukaryotic-like serine/threonine-protein kinase